MTELQLRIRVGEADHVYADPDMGAGAVEAGRAYRDGQVEADDVALTLDRADVCGWTSPLALPAGRHRAEVRDTVEDAVVLDGTVSRVGIGADDPGEGDGLRRWTVRVLDTALDDLLTALESVSLRSCAQAALDEGERVGWADVDTLVRDGADERRTPLRWWSARALLRAALGQVAASVAVPPLFDGAVRYLDGAGAPAQDAVPDRGFVAYVGPLDEGQSTNDPASTIPDVSGRAWWDTLSGLLSLPLSVRYEPWPSAGLVAEVTADRWAEPDAAGLVALDALALAGWDAETAPAEAERFEVRFANGLDEFALASGEPLPLASRFASSRAVYLTGVESDGATVALRQPRVADEARAGGPDYDARYGTPYLDADVDEPYLGYLQGASLDAVLVCYEAAAPAPEAPACYNPTWADVLFAGHALEASEVVRVQVEVDADEVPDAPRLLATQYAVEGLGLRTDEVRLDADSRRAALTLVRPAAGYAAVAAAVRVGPPTLSAYVSYWSTEDQAGGVADDGYEARAVARPGVGLSRPDRIEVEHDVGAGWTPGRRVDLGGSPQDVPFRARSVYAAAGYTSEWVLATATA